MKIEEVKGIGTKTKELFNRLNIYETEELIHYYPRCYDVYNTPVFIEEIDNEKIVSICGSFTSRLIPIVKGKHKIVSGLLIDEKGSRLQIVWYNMPFLAKTVNINEKYILRGTLKRDRLGNIEKLIQPEIYSIEKYSEKINSLQPIYSLTKGLSNNLLIKTVKEVLNLHKDIINFDYLPEKIRNNRKLISEGEAIFKIHFPKNDEDAVNARKRLSFDEFLMFILALRRLKNGKESLVNDYNVAMDEKTLKFIDKLPYRLTNAQAKVVDEIIRDMTSGLAMNRLIQGDVGSGKTIVAQIALMNTVFAGFQGAFMAPTEVLAKQHYDGFIEIFKKYNIAIDVVLLTGSMTAKEKKLAYERIESGVAGIIIGTHALITEKVRFSRLALVITDEQHRFGVVQRQNLFEKGQNPHVLVMSATPIPRTLAIILYGDLSISVINELPSDRLPIKNCVVTTDYREKAYNFIKNQIDEGHQVYIICPMVEENDNIEACDVVSYTRSLKEIFSDNYNIQYLHGKMKTKDKNNVMEEFSKGSIDILVSTTVIEVGVNVPNATVMMVENAERFGLAALHQLRGRVGRGAAQSYCIFVSGSKNKEKLDRLNILNKSNDGFFIAAEDLKMRGPGDLFGIRQSGELIFKIGDIYGDADMLKEADDIATEIENNTFDLSEAEIQSLNDRICNYTEVVFKSVNL